VTILSGQFKQLSLPSKLTIVGLIPTVFLLMISFKYYQAEKQKLELLQNNIRVIERAAAVNELIEQLDIERRYGYEFALKKDEYGAFKGQWHHTDGAISHLETVDPELKNITTYTLLDGLDKLRQNNSTGKMAPDAIMGYYTTTIFRISYLDASPELLVGNSGDINPDINGLKALSEMNIYLGIINSNIYNVLYTHSKYAVGTLYALVGLYQVYNTFEKEFLLKASPGAIRSYRYAKKHSSLKQVITYLDGSFKRMNIDSTYTDVQWWAVSGAANDQLKMLQLRLTKKINTILVNLETTEQTNADRLFFILLASILLIAAAVGYVIKDISTSLTELRVAAEKIAVGDTGIELGEYSDDVIGRLARSILRISENNKELAEAAQAIGGGDFHVPVQPRGESDLLGNAISRMKNELQQFTSEKLANAVELERLVEVIRASETHFRQIADQSPFMIWQTDDKGNAVYVNKRWLNFTGMSFDDSLGLGWAEMLHPEDEKDRPFIKAFAERATYASRARFKNADGEYRWMQIQGNPVFENRRFQGYIGSLTDVTDQLAAEQAILDLMNKKDEFLSIASHELKTPLTSIKAYAQILQKKAAKEDELSPFVTKTLQHVERLEKLINALLDVSRINSGQMSYDMETLEFDDLLRQSVESFGDTLPKHKIVIKNTITCTLKADRARIEQVINNLLNNAAKYSPDADTIYVDAFLENGSAITSVQDLGVGIAEKDWKLCFERFYRSEKTYNKFQGLGLGLFISSEIIKRHNGQIWVESELGKGSTFYFKLPVETGDAVVN